MVRKDKKRRGDLLIEILETHQQCVDHIIDPLSHKPTVKEVLMR